MIMSSIESLTKSTAAHITSKIFKLTQTGSINSVTLHSISKGPSVLLFSYETFNKLYYLFSTYLMIFWGKAINI